MSVDRVALADRAAILRAELKLWEKEFAAAHGGRKASREEIKEDVDIAVKYKEYHKTQDTLSGKAANPASGKRKRAIEEEAPSPKRQRSLASTPKKRVSKFREVGLVDSPKQEEEEITPTIMRTFIGPTPQKDGRVLGLFDMLPLEETLSRSTTTHETFQHNSAHEALRPISANPHLSTPRKADKGPLQTAPGDENALFASTQKPSRTPQSASKRSLLDAFVTPSKRRKRNADDDRDHAAGTANPPSSASKRFATPSFLRRDTQSIHLAAIAEDADDCIDGHTGASPSRARGSKMRWPLQAKGRPGSFGRTSICAGGRKSLSSMIAELRRQEDEALDEEMAVLREMEGGEEAPKASGDGLKANGDVLVEASQTEGVLGPDGVGLAGEESVADAVAAAERTEQPARIWKKRGQKRQTRRVIMRPVARRKSGGPTDAVPEATDEEEDKAVLETQVEDAANEPDADFAPGQQADADATAEPKGAEGGDGIVKRAARKISATAHANFRRLKIKSRGSGGKGGRFGRRR